MPKTSVDNGHNHTWNKRNNSTSYDNGHSHRIDIQRRIAYSNSIGGHSHRLMK